MRVVMIGPFGLRPKGTMRVRALPLACELVLQGHDVLLLMPPWHTPEKAPRRWQQSGVTLEYVSLGPEIPLLSVLSVTWRLTRRALAYQPDVIHCFKPKAYSGLAAWAIWQLRRLGLYRGRLIVDEDDWEGPGGWNDLESHPWPLPAFFAWQERWGLKHNDGVTVASRTLESIAWTLGLEPNRVTYLPNGAIARPAQGEINVRDRYGLGQAPIVLLYTRFFEYDVSRAVAVFQRVLAKLPKARLLVVGEGLFSRDEALFDRLVIEYGLADRVTRAGWVTPEQLGDHFAAADVAIYPFDDTLVNRAKCPVKLVDLLAAGVPVVADRVGQIGEYIVHGESGILVSGGEVEEMAAGVVRLLQDTQQREFLARRAAQRMRARFAWSALAAAALRAYRHVLD